MWPTNYVIYWYLRNIVPYAFVVCSSEDTTASLKTYQKWNSFNCWGSFRAMFLEQIVIHMSKIRRIQAKTT